MEETRPNITLEAEHAARLSAALDDAHPDIAAVLDGIPGARERAMASLARAREGGHTTIPRDEL